MNLFSGLVYDTRGEIKLCSDVMKRAVAIAEKFKLDDEQYMCHSSLANMYQKCGQPSQALRSVDLALKMTEKLRNKVGEKEMFIQKAQILVSLGDYLAAKHALKKAHKIKVLSDIDDGKLVKLFRCGLFHELFFEAFVLGIAHIDILYVNKMQEAALDLETNTDERRIVELREILADGSAELGNFSEAVEHYLATLQSQELLTSEKRADLYVSLAQTYADLRNYEEAIFYYRQELEERKENQEQSCRTLLNIAELEELRGSKYSVMCKIYMSAFEAARKAKHVKLQIRTLKSLMALQKVCKQSEHLKETEKKLESVIKKNGLSVEQLGSSGDEEEDASSDKENSDEDEEGDTAARRKQLTDCKENGNLSLSDLTLSDESDGDDAVLPAMASKPKKTKLARRNEKGETPLHRACIEGNLKKAKALIAQGHPTNPRDFCGWLPLHEACNHGHTELVRCLLDAGAWINDRGGERCGGVTPLIDAANCGNLAIVRLLVDEGANVHAKDDDGNTALDCLHAWYQRASDTMTASDMVEYNTTERLLQAKGGQSKSLERSTTDLGASTQAPGSSSGGTSFRERLSFLRQKKINKKASSHTRRGRAQRDSEVVSSSDELSDSDPVPYALPKLSPQGKGGASEYQSVIETIGSSVQRRLEAEKSLGKDKEPVETLSSVSLPALLDEREDVGDDWLINDVDVIKPKRKNSKISSIFTTSSTRQGGKRKKDMGETAMTKRSRLSMKHSRLAHVENILNSGISSSQDVLDKEPLVTVSSSNRKNPQSHPELFDDQSSSDACPVTSSTERFNSVSDVQDRQIQKETSLDKWDSDEELLSHMDCIDESLGENDSILSQRQFNTTITNDLPSSPISYVEGRHPAVNYNSSSAIRNEQPRASKSSSTSNNLLDELRYSRNQEFHRVAVNNNICAQPKSNPVILPSIQQQSQHQQPQHSTVSLPFESPICNTSLRIKVKIGEQTMLIPIQPKDQQRTILWLCQQTGQRYFNMFLVRPLLALNTSDGSVLSPTDTVASVLADNDVLTAVVRSWERPKLEERYLQACTLCLLEEPDKCVATALQGCDSSGILKLCDLGLSPSLLQPVFQAIEGQATLTELHLSGNRLGDTGVRPLMECLAGLPILKVLNLDCNGLSVEGINTMAAVLKQKANMSEYGHTHCLSALTTLFLGHNSVEDFAAMPLATILDHLKRLVRLDLPACGFTEALFTPVFCTALM
ncbi:tonsoku-like protein, partial [Plakobranchus ocellatus]